MSLLTYPPSSRIILHSLRLLLLFCMPFGYCHHCVQLGLPTESWFLFAVSSIMPWPLEQLEDRQELGSDWFVVRGNWRWQRKWWKEEKKTWLSHNNFPSRRVGEEKKKTEQRNRTSDRGESWVIVSTKFYSHSLAGPKLNLVFINW